MLNCQFFYSQFFGIENKGGGLINYTYIYVWKPGLLCNEHIILKAPIVATVLCQVAAVLSPDYKKHRQDCHIGLYAVAFFETFRWLFQLWIDIV